MFNVFVGASTAPFPVFFFKRLLAASCGSGFPALVVYNTDDNFPEAHVALAPDVVDDLLRGGLLVRVPNKLP